jgi:hypothetical protein
MQRGDRITAVVYSSYFAGLYLLANKIGLRKGEPPSTRFTRRGLETIAKLAGFEITRQRPLGYVPFRWYGIGSLINRVLQATPLLRWFGLAEIVMLRPILPTRPRSISILIPVRNEKGNLEAALARLPELAGMEREVVFVEGHSTDGSWEEIQRLQKAGRGNLKITALQQPGQGKADAVRFGLARATGELLTILDADLTVPPEYLTRFVTAYANGLGDFVNGTRLLYPAEGKAMRFLNWLGNIFFAKALGFVLDSPLGDSLCGTKLFARRDYERFREWRRNFGEFDPFGDFELLFPAAVLGLGTVDIPIRYRARTYGATNISRFRDGWTLLKMTTLGLFRIRLGNGT